MCDNTCDDDMMSLCANGKESGEDTDAEKGCLTECVCESLSAREGVSRVES